MNPLGKVLMFLGLACLGVWLMGDWIKQTAQPRQVNVTLHLGQTP